MYILGITFAIFAGLTNFFGQILQKKAVNNFKKEKSEVSMKDLVKNPLWLSGLFCTMIFSLVFLSLAQLYIGPALIPGLFASGFIVMGIGSVKILHEKLKKEEIIAIILIIIGIVLISLSKLSIDADIMRFRNASFLFRIILMTVVMFLIWYALFYGGKKLKKKAIFMSMGTGFPFVIANFWYQPLMVSVESILSSNIIALYLVVFFVSAAILAYVNLFGMIHLQKAYAEGNASVVIPLQQIPQQLAPILIYFFIYAMRPPNTISYIYLFSSMVLIIIAGFLISKRQGELEDKVKIDESK